MIISLQKKQKQEINYRIDQERVDDTFGNARTVRNIVLDAIFKKGSDKPRSKSCIFSTIRY